MSWTKPSVKVRKSSKKVDLNANEPEISSETKVVPLFEKVLRPPANQPAIGQQNASDSELSSEENILDVDIGRHRPKRSQAVPAVAPRKIDLLKNENPFVVVRNSEQPGVDERHSNLAEARKSRKSIRNSLAASYSNNDQVEHDDQTTVLRDIFTYNGKTIDLELYDRFIAWKRTNVSKHSKLNGNNTLYLGTFFNVEPYFTTTKISEKKLNEKNDDDNNNNNLLNFVQGFTLHYLEQTAPNTYKHQEMLFTHPHRDTTLTWIDNIKERIPAQQKKRKALVIINPYSGEKKTRSILNHSILPILKCADIEHLILEFHDKMPLRHTLIMNNVNFDDYYGIICICGDSGASKIINMFIELKAQQDEDFNLNEIDEFKFKLKTPFCIIPVGSTNHIASSIYGTTDINTPLYHFLYGNTIRVDLSCVLTTNNRLHSFGFYYSAGFGTSLARYFSRYAKLGTKKIQTSVARGVAKPKHRPIEVEIKYIKADGNDTCDEEKCFLDCKICDSKVKNICETKTFDQVEEFDPVATSIDEIERNLSIARRTKKYNNNNGNSSDWEIIQGTFTVVSFLSNCAYGELAPGGGLSKYAHLADGCIDLILVDQVSRKEFYRFVKRHANKKNQLTLPFVKSVRIKEAKIKILNSAKLVGKQLVADSVGSFSNSNYKQNSMQNSDNESVNFKSSAKTTNGHKSKSSNRNKWTSDSDSDMDSKNNFDSKSRKATQASNNINIISDSTSSNDEEKKPKIYFIKKTDYDNNEEKNTINLTASQEFQSNKKHKNPVFRKSRSILNLFQREEKQPSASKSDSSAKNKLRSSLSTNPGEKRKNDVVNNDTPNVYDKFLKNYDKNDLSNPMFTTYPGKNNFTSTSSFKQPSVWNCDGTLNEISEMHIKCLRKFLPVFGRGIDPETEFENSASSCLPI